MHKTYDHVIVGAGVAGTMAAEAIRAAQPSASVLIVGAEPHRLYSRVMLPHVVRGRTPEDKAFLRSESFYDEKQFDFSRGVSVTAVDAAARAVTLSTGEAVAYTKALLVATGGTPRRLDVPGAQEADPMHFNTIEDARRIMASSARSAVVYGGGFIGLELVMSMAHFGIPTTAVLRGLGFFWRVLDARGAEMIADKVRQAGVTLRFGEEVKAVEFAHGMKKIVLSRGEALNCDALGLGLGLVPNVAFLNGSGVAVNDGVLADAQLRTSAAGVFVAGDCAEAPDAFTGERRLVGNWQNAMFQGKVAGTNMAGGAAEFTQLTTYAISVFGLPVCFVGDTNAAHERLVREGIAGALQLFLKEGRVVGSTCVGPFPDRAAVTKLITERVPFTDDMRAAVRGGKTDLAALLP